MNALFPCKKMSTIPGSRRVGKGGREEGGGEGRKRVAASHFVYKSAVLREGRGLVGMYVST